MKHDRFIQLAALAMILLSVIASGSLLPGLIDQADRHALRYTDVSIEGAPPFVVVGQAIGAIRGLIVDWLWITVNQMKQDGKYYEIMARTEMITRLQPRFAAVWAFHGHNMAYNISVATGTREERWDWVRQGISLVRNEGLRYNPNDLVLHKELAFWFAHKIEGISDDAHLFYKDQMCREWHFLLGEPPDAWSERIAWMKEVADAPQRLEQIEQSHPEAAELIAELRSAYSKVEQRFAFELDRSFLLYYVMWQATTQQSEIAEIVDQAVQLREESAWFLAFDRLANEPKYAQAWKLLVAHARKRVLLDEYNMDPQLMYEFTRDLGPLDWRHGQAHAIYWSRRGSLMAEHRTRVSEDDIYKVLNNDSMQLQGMQGLARDGRIFFDPFSGTGSSRLPDARWVDSIVENFEHFYIKHINVRGAGGERFIDFLKHFLAAEVRGAFHRGELARADQLYAKLDELFGMGSKFHNPEYSVPVAVFVKKETKGQYEAQHWLAPREVADSLRYGLRVGLAQGEPELLVEALANAAWTTNYFKNEAWNDYVTRFGEARIGALVGELENSATLVFGNLMVDRSVPFRERMVIWAQVDKYIPQLRAEVYDAIKPQLERELATTAWGRRYTIDQAFPEPPGMDAYRAEMERRRQREREQLEEQQRRDAPVRN